MKTIGAKVDNDFYEDINCIAKDNNISVSALIKQALKSAVIRDKSLDIKMIYEVNRIGRNINQIAKHLNKDKVLDKQMFVLMVEIEKKLKELI